MISVCIATYNGQKYIKQQLDSILQQLSLNDEVVISDDGSTDKTISTIEEFNDERIRIIYNGRERGYSTNFENAIINARGDFIFLSDQDDVWNDDKISTTINHLKNYDFVVSDASFVDEELNELNYTFFDIRGGRTGFIVNLYKSQFLGACMAFKKEILTKLLPFPKNIDFCPHDLWISLVSEFYFKTKVINKPLIKYRRHEDNVSTGGQTSHNSFFKKIGFRCYCLFKILLRN